MVRRPVRPGLAVARRGDGSSRTVWNGGVGPMSYYVQVGDVPRKRHIWHRGPDGNRLAEELMGQQGFNGASSLLYHRHSPSAITGVEPVELARSPLTANNPLLPWHVRAPSLSKGGDLV